MKTIRDEHIAEQKEAIVQQFSRDMQKIWLDHQRFVLKIHAAQFYLYGLLSGILLIPIIQMLCTLFKSK